MKTRAGISILNQAGEKGNQPSHPVPLIEMRISQNIGKEGDIKKISSKGDIAVVRVPQNLPGNSAAPFPSVYKLALDMEAGRGAAKGDAPAIDKAVKGAGKGTVPPP